MAELDSMPGFAPLQSSLSQRRKWHPTPVLLPGESHGQTGPGELQSLGSDTTKQLTHIQSSLLLCSETSRNLEDEELHQDSPSWGSPPTSSDTGRGASPPALTHPCSRPAAAAGRAPMEGLGSSPGMSPRRGHRTRRREGLRAAVESASWARGRGAGTETGAGGVGRTGSVASGRRGTVLAGCWVGTPGAPGPLSMSRQGVE